MSRKDENARSPVLTTGRNAASEKYLKGATRMYNNERRSVRSTLGYTFQNDFLALSRAFSLPEIDYTDISQREQLAAAIKDGHSG